MSNFAIILILKNTHITFLVHIDVGQSAGIFLVIAGFPWLNIFLRITQFMLIIISAKIRYFASQDVFVGAISVRHEEAGAFDIFQMNAVLSSSQVVGLPLLPLNAVIHRPGASRSAAPGPRSPAVLLCSARPVVEVARPVAAFSEGAQTFLLRVSVYGQGCHAQTAARRNVALPSDL
jgi:hypothetical protein